jgi:adenosylcobinamide kinase/adenosylcobinamide-phosphate guanylyltransferase
MLTLVLGGARSGKSRYAQSLCSGRDVVFLATARDQGDPEWRARIARHRGDRPPGWRTVEVPIDLATALGSVAEGELAVVDCLGLWVSNQMDERRPSAALDVEAYLLAELERAFDAIVGRDAVIVSNEVGSATVPEHPVARRFRDLLGFANQAVARRADRVVLIVAGLPMVLKEANDQRVSKVGDDRPLPQAARDASDERSPKGGDGR